MTDTADAPMTLVGFRISPSQERLWLLGNSPYLTRAIVQAEGFLDGTRFRRAFFAVVSEHEILRTKLQVISGLRFPLQVIEPELHVHFSELDLTNHSPAARNAQVELFFNSETADLKPQTQNPYSLEAILVRNSADLHLILLKAPACFLDDESLRILMVQTCASYQSSDGRAPECSIQFPDIAEWQHELLSDAADVGGPAAPKLIASFQAVPPLAFEVNPAPDASYAARWVDVSLGPALSEALTNDVIGVPRQFALLASWLIVLCRLTGKPQLAVGMRSDGRAHESLRDAVGPIARFVPVEMTVERSGSFEDLAASLAKQLQDTYTWDGDLRDDVGKDQTSRLDFGFEWQPWPAITTDSMRLFLARTASCLEPFKLNLQLAETNSGSRRLAARLCYDARRIHPADACRVGEQWATLAAAAFTNHTGPIAHLPMTTELERKSVLEDFSGAADLAGPGDWGRNETVLSLIEHNVQWHPQQVAVVSAGRSLEYEQLYHQVTSLVALLNEHGVGPEVTVGIFLQRSPDLIVAILAVLKAGGAYVPLDPNYPIDRTRQIISDAEPFLLLTDRRSEALLEACGVPTLVLEDMAGDKRSGPASPEMTRPSRPNLAYILFTSGSTGRPLGVEITHANLLASTEARLRFYDGSLRRFLLLSSVAFDSSVAGIFGVLCGGGTLVVPDAQDELDPDRVIRLIARYRISHLLCLPSLYRLILDRSGETDLATLEGVIVAGEPLSPDVIARHRQQTTAALFNEYGPTEGTVWSSVCDCADWEQGQRVSIGRPISGSRVYVLDEHGHEAPIGVRGELWIGGDGVARGYRNHPRITAERFRPDPYGVESGGRLYRTGDLASFDRAGRLQFFGRIDDQVKIRGFRVEPAEVESAFREFPGIEDVAVIADSTGHSERGAQGPQTAVGLVAFLVLSGPAPLFAQLRQFLLERLPLPMVPDVCRVVGALARLPNGKLDREALRKVPCWSLPSGNPVASPITKFEKEIAATWQDVLGVSEFGLDDGFFDLGGHSLLLLKVHQRLKDRLGLQFPLLALLEHPTVRTLAVFLQEMSDRDADDGEESKIRPVECGLDAERERAKARKEALQQRHRRRQSNPGTGT